MTIHLLGCARAGSNPVLTVGVIFAPAPFPPFLCASAPSKTLALCKVQLRNFFHPLEAVVNVEALTRDQGLSIRGCTQTGCQSGY